VIKAAIEAMAKNGEFPSSEVPVEHIFSNEFVSSFDNFDKTALKARAEAAL